MSTSCAGRLSNKSRTVPPQRYATTRSCRTTESNAWRYWSLNKEVIRSGSDTPVIDQCDERRCRLFPAIRNIRQILAASKSRLVHHPSLEIRANLLDNMDTQLPYHSFPCLLNCISWNSDLSFPLASHRGCNMQDVQVLQFRQLDELI